MIRKMLVLFRIAVICCLIPVSCSRDEVTFRSLLAEMTDREALTYFPARHYVHQQFSSYNRESVSKDKDGWFANFDMSHFLRVENAGGRREFVMFDAPGPGAVVRWWMTFYKAGDGIIRVYIDNDTVPVLEGKPADMLRGRLVADPPLAVAVQEGAPLGEAGRDYDHNFYVPLPFSEHCKITYECDSLVMKFENEGVPVPQGYWWPDVFYNIGFRSYDKGVKVRSVTRHDLFDSGREIDSAGKMLLSDNIIQKGKISFSKLILPQDSVVVELDGKDQAVCLLNVTVKSAHLSQSLRSVVFEASFDGNRTIHVPAGEFFGSGYVPVNHSTRMNKTDGKGGMQSFWVMPFRNKCFLSFRNYGADTVSIAGDVSLKNYKWTSSSMYFGASWHEHYHLRSRDSKGSPFDLNFINIKGKGVYAGDQITLFNSSWQWWGEGDEKIFVDGESFPSSFGTGSEDYYGYSFGRPESFSHPFLSQPIGAGNTDTGITVNMRHRSLDAIPFSTGISSNIEMWHWADVIINYAMTTYYYILTPYTTNIVTDPESVRHPVVLSKNDLTLGEK